jgi:MFS family permease
MWFFIAFMPLLFPAQGFAMIAVFYFINIFLVALREPSLTSLIGESVPRKETGRYFAGVNTLQVSIGMCAILAAGYWLDLAGKGNAWSFIIMFLAASAFGYIAMGQFGRMREPARKPRRYTLLQAFKVDGEFRAFVTKAGLFWFAVYVGSYLTNAYMLKDLGLGASEFAVLLVLQLVAKVLCYGMHGRLADRHGDKPVAIIGVFSTALVMLFWFFVRPGASWWVMAPVQLFSGFAWAAVDIALFNLLLDYSKDSTRPMQTAQYSTVAASMNVLGALTGGVLASVGSFWFLPAGIPAALFVSFVLRVFAAAPFLSLREPRAKHTFHPMEMMHSIVRNGWTGPRHSLRTHR